MPSEVDLYDDDGALLGLTVSKSSGCNVTFGDIVTTDGCVSVTTIGDGELKPGESITLQISGRVKNTVVMGQGDIINNAYAGSTKVINKSATNPYGSPFRSDAKDNYPTEKVTKNSDLSDYRTVKATNTAKIS